MPQSCSCANCEHCVFTGSTARITERPLHLRTGYSVYIPAAIRLEGHYRCAKFGHRIPNASDYICDEFSPIVANMPDSFRVITDKNE